MECDLCLFFLSRLLFKLDKQLNFVVAQPLQTLKHFDQIFKIATFSCRKALLLLKYSAHLIIGEARAKCFVVVAFLFNKKARKRMM